MHTFYLNNGQQLRHECGMKSHIEARHPIAAFR